MILSVEIENFLGEHVECVLTNPFGHGLNITNITGLGPESINLVTQDLALIDGSVYSTQRKSERNIVITYRFIEAPDIETVRHRTYDLFGLGRWVKLTFNTDHRSLWIEGYVESNDPDIFSDGETSSVSIICPDPWFRSNIANRSTLLTVDDADPCGFEFVTDYGHEISERICFSELSRRAYYSAGSEENEYRYGVYNEGDRDVGFILRFVCKEETYFSHAYINNTTTGQYMQVDRANYTKFSPGDMYQINTIPAYKMISVYSVTDGVYKITPTLNDIVRDFSWPTLRKGHNDLTIRIMDSKKPGEFLEGDTVTNKFDLVVIHTPLYEGV